MEDTTPEETATATGTDDVAETVALPEDTGDAGEGETAEDSEGDADGSADGDAEDGEGPAKSE